MAFGKCKVYCTPVSGEEKKGQPLSPSATSFYFYVTRGTKQAVTPISGVPCCFGSLWGTSLRHSRQLYT